MLLLIMLLLFDLATTMCLVKFGGGGAFDRLVIEICVDLVQLAVEDLDKRIRDLLVVLAIVEGQTR